MAAVLRDVLGSMAAEDLSNLILQVKLQLLEPSLFQLFFFAERVLSLQFGNSVVEFVMLLAQFAEMLVCGHQVRFDFILRQCLHLGLSPSIELLPESGSLVGS
jgi:hypothetical protein